MEIKFAGRGGGFDGWSGVWKGVANTRLTELFLLHLLAESRLAGALGSPMTHFLRSILTMIGSSESRQAAHDWAVVE